MLQTSADILKRWWKSHGCKHTLQAYVNAIGVGRLKGLSLEDLLSALRSKQILQAQNNIVRRFKCVMKIDTEINVRVLNAIFMITMHPQNMFETLGFLEQKLLDKATVALTCYEAICSEPSRWDLVRAFQQPMMEYIEVFEAWRIYDVEKLKFRIERALLALYQVRDANPEPLDIQINRLRSRLISMDPKRMEQFDQMRQTMMVLE